MRKINSFFTARGPRSYFVALCTLLFLLVSSCKKDNFQPETGVEESDDSYAEGVQFKLQLPGLNSVITTYAIGAQEENAVQTIDVLAFKVNDKGTANETETFAYKVEGVRLTTPEVTHPANKTFRANLRPDGKEYYRFVILANVQTQLNSIAIAENEPKDNVLSKMVIAKSGQWNAASSSSYDPFPMWGESEQVIVNESTTEIGRISMLRSLARIDVNLSGSALANFSITAVSVINGCSNGLIAPLSDNYSAASGQVTAESIPAAPTFNDAPVTYAVPAPGLGLQQQIYVFESSKTSLVPGQTTSTELMIAGRYNGSTEITYYRIAFLKADGQALALLRNHRYTVNISKVAGVGYPNMAIALKNVPANMEVATSAWDDSGMNVMATDGQYILALSNDQFTVNGATGQKINFTLYTDYPFGWYVQTKVSWLGVTYVKSGNRYVVTLTTQNTSNTGATSARIANVLITTGGGDNTGRISRIIKVTQLNK